MQPFLPTIFDKNSKPLAVSQTRVVRENYLGWKIGKQGEDLELRGQIARLLISPSCRHCQVQ